MPCTKPHHLEVVEAHLCLNRAHFPMPDVVWQCQHLSLLFTINFPGHLLRGFKINIHVCTYFAVEIAVLKVNFLVVEQAFFIRWWFKRFFWKPFKNGFPIIFKLIEGVHLPCRWASAYLEVECLARYWHVLNINVTVQSNTDARYLQKLTVFRRRQYWGSCKTKKKAGTWPGGGVDLLYFRKQWNYS